MQCKSYLISIIFRTQLQNSYMRLLKLSQPAAFLALSLILIRTAIARPPHQLAIPHVTPVARDTTPKSLDLIPSSLPSAPPATIPLPNALHYPLQFALDRGWSVAISVYSYVYPLSPNARALEDFFTQLQAGVLARVVQGFANPCRFRFVDGDLALNMHMHPRSTLGSVDWIEVHAFAEYMLRWVRRGFSMNGGMLFYHRSGILLVVTLLNHDSVGLPENTVEPDECLKQSPSG